MRRVTMILAVLALVGLLPAQEAAAQFAAAGRDPNPVTVELVPPPGDPVNLVLDDGSRDNAIGLTAGGQFIWLNRFSPTEFPIELDTALVLFSAQDGINLGETFDVYLYQDTDGDGDPGTGAVYVGGVTGNTVAVLDNWTTVNLGALGFSGPGDVLVAVVNRTAGVIAGTFPAAIDQTASQGRSWIGIYSAGNPGNPPTLPADAAWGTIDSFGFGGNWMIRASGSVVPVELQSFDIE